MKIFFRCRKGLFALHALPHLFHVIKFLREAALDPKVETIKITIYRLSKISQVISSLINAAKNGKKYWCNWIASAFDENNNIDFANKLKPLKIDFWCTRTKGTF